MNNTEYKARMVRAKTREVLEYHRDADQPGKPLHLLVPGALIALAALGLIVFIAYKVWLDGSLAQTTGVSMMGILTPFYIGGVFLFSYGYELYNLPRAIRLTAIIVFVTVAAVVMVAVLLVLAGALGNSKSSSSSSSSSSNHSSSSGSSVRGSSGVHSGTTAASASGTGGGAGVADGIGRVVGGAVSGLGSGHSSTTRVVTREVVREVPVGPVVLPPVACPFCGRSYVPAQANYVCPSCSAATPPNLIPK